MRVLCAFAFVVCVALSREGEWWRLGALGGLLLAGYVVGRVPLLWALKRLPLLIPLLMLVGLSGALRIAKAAPDAPRTLLGPWLLPTEIVDHYGSVLIGASLSVAALALLAYRPGIEEVLRALRSFLGRSIFVTLLTMTHRYIVVITGEVSRMIRARDSRGTPPRVIDRARVAGAMVGNLFLRSLDRAERVGHAMEARGFTGVYPTGPRPRVGLGSVLVGVLFCAATASITWL